MFFPKSRVSLSALSSPIRENALTERAFNQWFLSLVSGPGWSRARLSLLSFQRCYRRVVILQVSH
jgi:hypothetical protein